MNVLAKLKLVHAVHPFPDSFMMNQRNLANNFHIQDVVEMVIIMPLKLLVSIDVFHRKKLENVIKEKTPFELLKDNW